MPKIPEIVDKARQGNVAEVLRLVAAGEDVNQADMFGFTALMCMAAQGQFEACKALVEAGADTMLVPNHGPCKDMTAQDIADTEQSKLVDKDGNPGNGYCLVIKLLEPEDAVEDELLGA